ncbi:hypothetical protein RJ035_005365, partial [Blastomyces gilchristii]
METMTAAEIGVIVFKDEREEVGEREAGWIQEVSDFLKVNGICRVAQREQAALIDMKHELESEEDLPIGWTRK